MEKWDPSKRARRTTFSFLLACSATLACANVAPNPSQPEPPIESARGGSASEAGPADASGVVDTSSGGSDSSGDSSGMDASEPFDASTAPDAAEPDATPPVDAGDTSDAMVSADAESVDPVGSCAGLPPICGATHTDDCCATSVIPGGTFNRDNDPLYPATVSPFRLDKYEVTVGRFRKFFAALESGWRPVAGSGKNPNAANDPGWLKTNQSFVSPLMTYQGPFCESELTWTPSPVDVAGESRPVNCISWESAFAFCIWDGGRLPTETEWLYAATGGGDASGQRQYPWSSPSASRQIDPTDANYYVSGCTGPCLIPVGSRPNGDGRFGQSDLSGNVAEWVLDWGGPYPLPCHDCIASASDPMQGHALRGGSMADVAEGVLTSARHVPTGNGRGGHYYAGMRCARAP